LFGLLIGASLILAGCGDSTPKQPDKTDAQQATKQTGPTKTKQKKSNDGPQTVANNSNVLPGSTFKNDRDAANPTTQSHKRTGQVIPPREVQPVVFRPSYRRPDHNVKRIQALGFRQLLTSHVELITDISSDKSAPLMPAVEQLHPFLEKYFGALAPARDGRDYMVTGYLMVDRDKFFASGLAKEKLVGTFHGRQIGAEFWLNNQTLDYYRRHLLLHEIVHCYMRHLPNNDGLPAWYLEGMAEMIATHRDAARKFEFSVMPRIRSRYSGLERIVLIQRDVKKRGMRSLGEITNFSVRDFSDVETYAWCWALCRFLDSHQSYQKEFRDLAKKLGTVPFRSTLNAIYADRSDEFATEWALFANGIVHGFDFDRAAIKFVAGKPLATTTSVTIDSALGWQSSAIAVEKGKTYSLTASGRFSVAQEPKPWISEANGVSIRYVNGRPIGQLIGAVWSENRGNVAARETMLQDFALGNAVKFTAPVSGTLYLRINDHFGELADNKGALDVTVEVGR
jgi:hypothetical protein